jgi:hypothetical protein
MPEKYASLDGAEAWAAAVRAGAAKIKSAVAQEWVDAWLSAHKVVATPPATFIPPYPMTLLYGGGPDWMSASDGHKVMLF